MNHPLVKVIFRVNDSPLERKNAIVTKSSYLSFRTVIELITFLRLIVHIMSTWFDFVDVVVINQESRDCYILSICKSPLLMLVVISKLIKNNLGDVSQSTLTAITNTNHNINPTSHGWFWATPYMHFVPPSFQLYISLMLKRL